MAKLTVLLIILLFSNKLFSQTNYVFSYDFNGNRILRVVPTPKKADSNFNYNIIIANSKGMINVFPNPTKSIITVTIKDYNKNNNYKIYLFDINNRLIKNIDHVGKINILDLTEFGMGVYQLKVTSNNSSTDYKIIKQ